MSVSEKHPSYVEMAPDWAKMRLCYKGERAVKDTAEDNLPHTEGMLKDGALVPNTKGAKAYEAYKMRAKFPDSVKESVTTLLGVMHNKPATIELPPEMEVMRDNATLREESLQMVLRKINEQQLLTGRVGVMGDIKTNAKIPDEERRGVVPYLALYNAEHCINWDEGDPEGVEVHNLNLVVLDESGPIRNGFKWETQEVYRVLALGDPLKNEPAGEGVYRVAEVVASRGTSDREEAQGNTSLEGVVWETPMVEGKAASEIPFVFANTLDVVPAPESPPLLSTAEQALSIYRNEADYQQSLFLQGQDTLTTIGSTLKPTDELRTGAGARIDLPMGGKAEYIGVDSSGLPEQRIALENAYAKIKQASGHLLEAVSRERESGEALRLRVGSRTVTLNQIVMAGAYALELVLKKLARWMGYDAKLVVVRPNMDFVDDTMTGRELGEIMGAKKVGAPISLHSIHEAMADRGMTKLDLEAELSKIEEEKETWEGLQETLESARAIAQTDNQIAGRGTGGDGGTRGESAAELAGAGSNGTA